MSSPARPTTIVSRQPPRLARIGVALAVVLLAKSGGLGCQSSSALELCGEIPRDGCPVGRGGTCEDPSCAAVYDCVEGTWTSLQQCAPDLDAGAVDAGKSEPACTSPGIEIPAQETGCSPGLQNPDCPIEAMGSCIETACTTGCTDFFACTTSGWTELAYCSDDGSFFTL